MATLTPGNADSTKNRKPNRQPSVRSIVNQLGHEVDDFSVQDVAARTGTSRQAVHRQLAQLVRTGVITSAGKGRATRYRLAAPTAPLTATATFERRYAREGLAEDHVWNEVVATLSPLSRSDAKNARAVMGYALTEMVNNAIDHSGAAAVDVRAGAGADTVWFEVQDDGVGAFENVRAALGLPDALAGLQEISKGKHTTQPERHSGEGIFFTSKLADSFELRANGLAWIVDNRRNDHALGAIPPRPGTTVRVEVAIDKAEAPEAIFARYTHDFEFDTTRTVVKLFTYGVRFVSRSEAKRLLETLDRFRHVIIDFAGVEAVGQGFADEVFRVWANAHPSIELRAENMSPPVAFMVDRARTVGK
jgi:anti-sigma regulatory factor (Ser/Thr protein kinase)/DNA-binding transcriptional ArsR family regulator